MRAAVRTIVVMGVSGSGKSTVAARIAQAKGWQFIEADDYHPPSNIAKMAAGRPLDDADRAPWLATLAQLIERTGGNVVACSALKRSYRDVLRQGDAGLMLVFLKPDRCELERRVARRVRHFMPSNLLPTQLDTLELPTADEDCLVIDRGERPDAIVALVRDRLRNQTEALSPPSTKRICPLT